MSTLKTPGRKKIIYSYDLSGCYLFNFARATARQGNSMSIYFAVLKGVHLAIWTVNICPLTILYKALLNIIGGKGAISNINYYHYHRYMFLYIFSGFRQKRIKMAVLLLASIFTLFTVGNCGNYTVTEEVFFDIEVKDMDGPGEDYRGRFVVGVFGETAPMTAMNFVAIARGYKRGKVRNN